jgi:hypothetical protein
VIEVKQVLTAQGCRRHSAECQRLAEQTGNARVKGILLDMARTWTRLALEAEQWNQENSPTQRLSKNSSAKGRVRIICPNPLPPHASPPVLPDS